MANPCLLFDILTASCSFFPSTLSCLEALSTKSKHWQLQHFNSFLKTDFSLYGACSSVFNVAMTRTVMLLESKLRQKHSLDQISLMRAGKSECMYLYAAPFLSLSRIDRCPQFCSEAHCRSIRRRIFRNERSKIIISDISIQPLVQASTRAFKSIQANLDLPSHNLSFSGVFLFKLFGSLQVKIISNNL